MSYDCLYMDEAGEALDKEKMGKRSVERVTSLETELTNKLILGFHAARSSEDRPSILQHGVAEGDRVTTTTIGGQATECCNEYGFGTGTLFVIDYSGPLTTGLAKKLPGTERTIACDPERIIFYVGSGELFGFDRKVDSEVKGSLTSETSDGGKIREVAIGLVGEISNRIRGGIFNDRYSGARPDVYELAKAIGETEIQVAVGKVISEVKMRIEKEKDSPVKDQPEPSDLEEISQLITTIRNLSGLPTSLPEYYADVDIDKKIGATDETLSALHQKRQALEKTLSLHPLMRKLQAMVRPRKSF